MAAGEISPSILASLVFIVFVSVTNAQVLTPPYFNIAQGRNITATATCGVPNVELYCRLTGATGYKEAASREVIQGQLCDYCNPSNPSQDHGPEFAIDGTQSWWQSPPLSRGMQFNAVNLTIHLGQEFHVAYVFIKMANSPRPGVWALERSTDFGKTWLPWQYFADTPSDCYKFFRTAANTTIDRDDQVICTNEFSKVVPLQNGEIVVSLVNGRPNAQNFSYAYTLQNWTKATDIRLRLIRTKNLLGHLMAIARQDPTVTRRYYYSIKDISVGGRCVCNGHAETCDRPDLEDKNKLLCTCQHNTCGDQCEFCCPGFVQKKWRRALIDRPFQCEPCQCYGHSRECIYDEDVAGRQQSIDIFGKKEGGGVCQNCQHNTMGINCEKCVAGYYRPYGIDLNQTDACRPCECDLHVSTGECEAESGRCLCRREYTGEYCDRCSAGYFGYPNCVPCECNINGTENAICTVQSGHCPCKFNYVGRKCDMCAFGFYDFPECRPCECNQIGAPSDTCNVDDGQCQCQSNYGSRDCSQCADGFFGFPRCDYCNCDSSGTQVEICEKQTGMCICMPNYTGERCDRCTPGFFGFPRCQECRCSDIGSLTPICTETGQCRCQQNYGGINCDRCAPGYYKFPDCIPCNCDLYGSLAVSCNETSGQCSCRRNFDGIQCEKCLEGLYNYPICEACNCNPNGAKEVPGYPLGGCGTVRQGHLCECKDRVHGRFCEKCIPGYWNLNRNNPVGCEECMCFKPGTLAGINVCDSRTGQCMCKPDVGGQDCDQCLDGYFDLQEGNPFGCYDCQCDTGGSVTLTCDKLSGQCVCKPRVTGLKCNKPIDAHYFPTLHQYQFEIEDGLTPEGAKIRYGYDERIFPGYSWRGYAILTGFQPEVLLEIDISKPSLYYVIYRYINRNDNTVTGEVTLTPTTLADIEQKSSVTFAASLDPAFTNVGQSGVSTSFVLNPGRWTISTKVPEAVFLDYFVLIPQGYFEASVLQEKIIHPCAMPGDQGPCLHYEYPNILVYPTVRGENAYVIVDQNRASAGLVSDNNVLDELGSAGLVVVNKNQTFFYMDLVVPDPGMYVLLVNYHNPSGRTQDLNINIASLAGRETAMINLYACKYSTLCRQVVKDDLGMVAMFNISTGYISLTITGDENSDVAIDSVVAVPYSEWKSDFIKPRIICIRVNGICLASTYSTPVGSLRLDFEQPPNEHLLAVDLPHNVHDTSVGLVFLNTSQTTVEVGGTVSRPSQYVFLVHFYMPSEVGLTIPVTVFTNGQIVEGVFSPTYCPSVTGCRATIRFPDTGDIVTLKDPSVRLLFNNTKGGRIWLDYVLASPANQFSPRDLELQPIDKSGEFLEQCVDEGFVLKSDSEFCRESVFTLTSEYNNGALPCSCDIDGSLSFTCEPFGGQCECRENVIGRNCTVCKPGNYGFPRCKPCNCPYGLCHPFSGECICPPRVEGERCDRCAPETYGFDPLIGCQLCNCDQYGVEDEDLNCDQQTGECRCKPNVAGRRCDTCDPGYHSFPYCQKCICDQRGTLEGICNQRTSECLCKDHVTGSGCDNCAADMFYLDRENPKGCTKCFCFGTTSRCDSSALFWDKISDMADWEITNTVDGAVIDAGRTIAVRAKDNIADPQAAMYWVAPSSFLGNKIKSYGGKLSYSVLYTLPRENPDRSEGLIKPDVILTGNNMTIVHNNVEQPVANAHSAQVLELYEYNFVHQLSSDEVSRELFMMILINLQALHIRASYYTLIDEARLTDVSLEKATEAGLGDAALDVEQCQCPPNYKGTSCEECALGYYRSHTTPYLGICVPCECNNHADSCDPVTGECLNCKDNTTGTHCEKCLAGYYGDTTTGGCSICACPLPVPSNNFATSCIVSEDGRRTFCECKPGYYGPNCEACAPGHYGDPSRLNDYCRPCGCSGNINVNDPGSCDRMTGQCLICLNNTAGSDCGLCKDWWFGDAIRNKDCSPCTCSRCGSDRCENVNGVCMCKPNIIGPDCDRCAPYTYGYEYCTGCITCDCGAASVDPQCDLRTGQCTCQPGVVGQKCDQCENGYWNYGPQGCQKCDCLSDGAITCDPESGRCQCYPGVTGRMCDKCLPRWVLVPDRGCRECDECVNILLDDLDVMDRNVTVTRRQLASVSVGVAAFQKLAQINHTVSHLRPYVESLHRDEETVTQPPYDTDEIAKLADTAQRALDRAKQAEVTAAAVADDVLDIRDEALTTERDVRMRAADANSAVEYVNTVLRRILERIHVTNIDTYISEAERILDEIVARNFTSANESSKTEHEEAIKALDAVKVLLGEVQAQLDKTKEKGETVTDIGTRFYDLQNSSRFSLRNAQDAFDIVSRLKAVTLEVLDKNLKSIAMNEEDTISLLDMARELLDNARMALDSCTEAFFELGRVSSRLDKASTALSVFVGDLSARLNGTDSLVNESLHHAAMLSEQAHDLDSLYMDTREVASNALTAANSYRDIDDAIDKAYNASKMALSEAEDALNKSSGVGDTSAKSKERSSSLLQKADSAFDKTENALFDRLTVAKTSTENLEKQNDNVENMLKEVHSTMDNIPVSPGSRAQAVIDIATDATLKIKDINDQLAGYMLQNDKNKTQELGNAIFKTKRNMQLVQNQIRSVRGLTPDIQELLGTLGEKATKLTDVGNVVSANVNKLKQRIALARDEANRIRVGTKFLGNTTVTLRNPPNVEQAGSYTKVSFFIQTDQSNGLLMYLGGDQKSGRPMPDDYLALEIVGGKVIFKFDLGSGAANVVSDVRVDDNKWHQITATRIGKTGTLEIRTDEEPVSRTEGTSDGTFTVLALIAATANMFVGGVPHDVAVPPSLITYNFIGAMEELKFDDETLGLWNFVSGENNYEGHMERDVMKSIVSNGLRFNGKGYAILSAKEVGLRPAKVVDVILKFKTYADNGLLVYMDDGVKSKDFLSVEMHDGMIFFQYELGSGRAKLMSTDRYNDGEWHQIQASRSQKDGLLQVDGVQVDIGGSPGGLKQLSIQDFIFVGGYNQILINKKDVTSIGFDGCVKDIQFGSQTWDLNDNKGAIGVDAGCPEQIARVATFSADRPGYIAVAANSIGSMFDLTFKMRTFENDSLLLYAANDNQENAFSVAISKGKIVVTSNPGGEKTVLQSRVNEYSDGKWHYLSIMKSGQKLTMNIDDQEMIDSTTENQVDNLMTTTPLYFGGVPPTYTITETGVPTTLRTVGCIGDVTVNDRFINFASIKESDRPGINLAGCPITGEEDWDSRQPGLVPETGEDTGVDKPDVEPSEHCALPAQTDLEATGTVSGTRFGAEKDSRREYHMLPTRFILRSIFSVEFKTSAEEGVIFYVNNEKHTDYIGLSIMQGYVVYGFNSGSGRAFVTSPRKYNDGRWHTVTFARVTVMGTMEIDGEKVGNSKSGGGTRSINVKPPYYVGGIPVQYKNISNVKTNLKTRASSFVGCLRNFQLNNKDFGLPSSEISVYPCSDAMEVGTFYHSSGGYVTLYDKFKVGLDLEISLDVRPRSTSGVLLAVHSPKGDYLVLQMIEGKVHFIVDNGGGAIETTFEPGTKTALCDGQWHTIEAVKTKEVINLKVDGRSAKAGIGKPGVSSADTKDPLFVGGAPDFGKKGISAGSNYLGCIRNLYLNNMIQYVGSGSAVGDVKMDSCPVQ
ncbi:laminin subunit alpha-like [Gigantopelta aegis]|uniref:laminin subunit alpha-like n=1 Tax=Gigantopelta aegis TaxID=1735272 RepID=UPI001B887CE1|nr:laminin subunit alpha-like [Gigantopelta aegis]